VFEKDGHAVVYAGPRYEETAVVLGAASASLVVVKDGLREGERVALSDPECTSESERPHTEVKAP